ncbi:unnamed protein product [Amaranthus hypochondriacus]
MNRITLLRLSIRLANSLSTTRHPGFNSLRLTQVTHYSSFFQSFPFCHSKCSPSYCISTTFHQKLYFSSKAESVIELILSSNDWSENVEKELEALNPKLTHESVVYVLRKLNSNPQKSLGFFNWVRAKKNFEPSYLPFHMLLRTLACREFMEEFWKLASEMKKKGLKIDLQVSGGIIKALKNEKLDDIVGKWNEFLQSMKAGNGEDDVVKDIVKLILECNWSTEVERKLENVKLKDDFLFKVIWKLKNEPLSALKFFEWLASSRKFEHNSITYSGMARVLARRGFMSEFWDLLTRMRSEGFEIESYVALMRCVGNEDAVKLFEFMMDGPYKLLEHECVVLLKKLSHDFEPDMVLVMRVVNKYLEAGNTYTKATYDTIHRCLCKLGRFDEAKKIMEDMRNAGCKPDNITYSQEVFGLCKLKRFDDACALFKQMVDEGCVPDLKTWTILLQGYCAAGQVDQALSCFEQMLEENHEPDGDTLDVLIKGFILCGKTLDAYKFLVETVNKAHLKPWQATYKTMIEMLLRDGKLEEAFNLLSMMKQQNYPPYPEPFVEYISKSGSMEDAKHLLGALPKKGSPSTAAYVKMISSFFEAGRHSEAKDLLYDSPSQVRTQKTIQEMFGFAPNIHPS